MRKAARGPSDALPVRPSALAPENCAENVEGDDDEDLEAGFNPAWMVPDRSGRFYWYKKKQTEGSLTHTPQLRVGDRDDDHHQQLQAGLADAAHGSNTPPSMTEATSFEPLAIDRLAEGAVQWAEAKSGARDEHTPDEDIPVLERDNSFSRMLAHARLAGKRARASPIPETPMASPPPPSSYPQQPPPRLPLPLNDAPWETAPVGQQSSVSRPPPPPLYSRPGDNRWKNQSAVLETFSTPEIHGQVASETLSPMLDAVVPTALPPPPPSTDPPRPEGRRQQPRHIPLQFWSTSTMHTKPDENKRPTDRPASEGSSPARFCSLQPERQPAPVDKWAMLDSAVPKMLPPSAGRALPGRQWEARDGAERVSSAPPIRRKLDEKRVWERPVSEESTTAALPPLLSLPLPHVSPLVPTARRQTPTKLGRNGTLGYEFPASSEERLTLPSSLQAASPSYGHPQNKRARDNSALTSSPRPPPPPSPPCQQQDLQSAGWSPERTSTGALFWHNRFTGQFSRQKPAHLPTCQ